MGNTTAATRTRRINQLKNDTTAADHAAELARLEQEEYWEKEIALNKESTAQKQLDIMARQLLGSKTGKVIITITAVKDEDTRVQRSYSISPATSDPATCAGASEVVEKFATFDRAALNRKKVLLKKEYNKQAMNDIHKPAEKRAYVLAQKELETE